MAKVSARPPVASNYFRFDRFWTPDHISKIHLIGFVLIDLIASAQVFMVVRQSMLINSMAGLDESIRLMPVTPYALIGGMLFYILAEALAAIVVWRIFCDLVLVLFRIHANVERLRINAESSSLPVAEEIQGLRSAPDPH